MPCKFFLVGHHVGMSFVHPNDAPMSRMVATDIRSRNDAMRRMGDNVSK